MAIFVIGDLHLSFNSDKPMDVFGEHWLRHYEKIESDWRSRVQPSDLVILAGDTSWASSLEDAARDLAWIEALPGKKLLLKGNHDYWWTTVKKMRAAVEEMDFLHNSAYLYQRYAIVGTRGWDAPLDFSVANDTLKIYNRECNRLKLSIDAAPKSVEKICVLHYPPFDERGRATPMTEIIEQSGIERVYFGHIHSAYHNVRQGVVNGVEYRLISCDYLDFKLYKITD